MTETINDEYIVRKKRLENLTENGIVCYVDKFDKKQSIKDALKSNLGVKIKTAGRILTLRVMGNIAFCHIADSSGTIQLVFKKDEIGKEGLALFTKNFDSGDFIGVEGKVFKTQKGELSILVKKFKLLSKTLRPLPEKWHGLKDKELTYRQRYLDLISNKETFDRFIFRSECIKVLREFYWQNNFIEVETPILTNTASGALATPFKTHHNALDMDVYLRIAPETYLKEAIVGGFEKVFEVARVFRNEGIDPSHLQDFTMIEHYAAYWDFEDNIKFTEKMFTYLLKKLFGKTVIELKDRSGKKQKINFKPPFRRVTFRDLILKDSGIDIEKFIETKDLLDAIKKKKIIIEGAEKLGRGNLIDALYKEVSRHKLVEPTFVINHPVDVSPLARRNDNNPEVVDRFQFVINTWEIVNAYSELIDPIDQKQRFASQAKAKAGGDTEAHGKDDEFVRALEHGAPPMSGWGMGVDRLITLLTAQDNLRDVVLFPLMKPEHYE